jgi:hypothetical protein
MKSQKQSVMRKTKMTSKKYKHTTLTVSEAIGVFERAFRGGDPSAIERLLREMLNVQVAIIETKEKAEKLLALGKKLNTVSVPFGVFLSRVKEILKVEGDENANNIYCVESEEASPFIDTGLPLRLSSIRSLGQVEPGKSYVVLSRIAGYSEDKGLTFNGSGISSGWEDETTADLREKTTGGCFQTWKQHVEGVWNRSDRLANLYSPFIQSWARSALAPNWQDNDGEEKLSLFVQNVLWAMRVAVLFHDIGKLRKTWQKTVWENERTITGNAPGDVPEDKFIARTSPFSRGGEPPKLRRPEPHAPYAYPFLSSFFRSIVGDWRFLESAIALASARHHSLEVSGSVKAEKFELMEGAKEFLQSFLPKLLELSDVEKEKVSQALDKAIDDTGEGSQSDEPPAPSDDFYFIYCLTNRMVKVADWEDASGQAIELKRSIRRN